MLPATVRARVSVEEAATFGWERYVGLDGQMVGMHTFGASAPLKELREEVRVHAGRRGRRGPGPGREGEGPPMTRPVVVRVIKTDEELKVVGDVLRIWGNDPGGRDGARTQEDDSCRRR